MKEKNNIKLSFDNELKKSDNKFNESSKLKNYDKMTFEETLLNLINIIPFVVMVIDEDHTILLANKTILTALGKKLEEVVGRFCPKLIHGSETKYKGCPLEEANKKGEYVEKVIQDPFYKSWVISSVYPTSYITEDGKKVFLHVVRDITEQKKAEEELLKSERKFRTIVETAPSMLSITDKKGNSIYVSPNCLEIAGYQQEELLNKNFGWVHEDEKSRLKEVFESSFRKKNKGKNFEYKAVKKNGDIWYASSSWTPIIDEVSNFSGYIIETLDITERRIAMEQLIETKNELEKKSKNLGESNIALKVLIEHQVQNINNAEKSILENIKALVLPYIEKLKYSSSDEDQITLLNIIETNILEIIKPFTVKLTNIAFNFSLTEVRVAKLVKEGKTAKEIAEIMNISVNTVKEHNSQIRKKLKIKRKKINLRTYLQSFFEEQ